VVLGNGAHRVLISISKPIVRAANRQVTITKAGARLELTTYQEFVLTIGAHLIDGAFKGISHAHCEGR